MDSHVDVDEVALRASRYWMEDGLVEMMLGLLFILLGAGSLARLVLPHRLSLDLLTSALTASCAFGFPWGLKKLKERITFPRRGYVALPQRSKNYRISIVVMLAGLVATVSLTAADRELLSRMAVPGTAVIFALSLLLPGLQVKLPRMMWQAGLPLIFGAILTWLTPLRGVRGVVMLMIMMGIAMAIAGVFQLRSFLRANP